MSTDWKEEVSKCSKCGKCQTVCPVFLETGDESTVARGRISLAEALRDKQLVYTDKLRDYVYSCKKCMRCSTICPSEVDYEVIISALLRGVADEMGIPLLPKIIFRYILPRRRLFDLMLKVGSKIQRFIPGRGGARCAIFRSCLWVSGGCLHWQRELHCRSSVQQGS